MTRLPTYRLHRASGQAIVTINGRDYYLGKHNSPESTVEYNRLIAEYLASDRSPIFGMETKDITVTELLGAYISFANAYYGEGNKSETAKVVLAIRPMRALYGSLPARNFGPLQFKAVREKLVTEVDKKRQKPRSRSYCNDCMKRIARIYKWAAAEGILPETLYNTLRLIPGLKSGRTKAVESKTILSVSDADVEATIKCLPGVVADMVRLQRLTGMRPGEMCGLTPGLIDRSKDIWTADLIHHKTKIHGKKRIIFIGPKAQQILKRYLLRGPDEYCFRPIDSEKSRREKQHQDRVTPLSCGNKPGTNRVKKPKLTPTDRYDVSSYRRAVTRAAETAKVPHWHPNQLRHTAATEIRRQFGLEASQVILGHSELNTTQIYAEADIAKAIDVARRIG